MGPNHSRKVHKVVTYAGCKEWIKRTVIQLSTYNIGQLLRDFKWDWSMMCMLIKGITSHQIYLHSPNHNLWDQSISLFEIPSDLHILCAHHSATISLMKIKKVTESKHMISLEKLLKNYNASPYALYSTEPSRKSLKRKLEPIRTSLKTFQGKEKLGIVIIQSICMLTLISVNPK